MSYQRYLPKKKKNMELCIELKRVRMRTKLADGNGKS